MKKILLFLLLINTISFAQGDKFPKADMLKPSGTALVPTMSTITSFNLPASSYFGFGTTVGNLGYGIRDNGGSIEFKGSGGVWTAIPDATGSAGGFTLLSGSRKIYQTTANDSVFIRTNASDTSGVGLLNVYGNIYSKSTTYPSSGEPFYFVGDYSSLSSNQYNFRSTHNVDFSADYSAYRVGGVLGEVYLKSTMTGTLGQAVGLYGYVQNYATGATLASASGLYSVVANRDACLITNMYGVKVSLENDAAGAIGTTYGLYVPGVANAGGGSITTAYGLYLATQSTATNNYGIYQQGSALNFFGGNTQFDGVMSFSTDTKITRTAAGTLEFKNGGTSGSSKPHNLKIYNYEDGTDMSYGQVGWTSDNFIFSTNQGTVNKSYNMYFKVAGAGDLYFNTNATDRWRVSGGDGMFLPKVTDTYDLGSNTLRVRTLYVKTSIDFDSLKTRGEVSELDSVTYITLNAGTAGWGEVMVGDNVEWASFRFTSAGVVTIIAQSTNVSTTKYTASSLNIYDNGTNVGIQNYTGTTRKVAVKVNYYTP